MLPRPPSEAMIEPGCSLMSGALLGHQRQHRQHRDEPGFRLLAPQRGLQIEQLGSVRRGQRGSVECDVRRPRDDDQPVPWRKSHDRAPGSFRDTDLPPVDRCRCRHDRPGLVRERRGAATPVGRARGSERCREWRRSLPRIDARHGDRGLVVASRRVRHVSSASRANT